MPLINTIKQYFKFTTNITQSENNIAYMNDTCKEVAKHIRNFQYQENAYEVGEVLVCREHFQIKQITLMLTSNMKLCPFILIAWLFKVLVNMQMLRYH